MKHLILRSTLFSIVSATLAAAAYAQSPYSQVPGAPAADAAAPPGQMPPYNPAPSGGYSPSPYNPAPTAPYNPAPAAPYNPAPAAPYNPAPAGPAPVSGYSPNPYPAPPYSPNPYGAPLYNPAPGSSLPPYSAPPAYNPAPASRASYDVPNYGAPPGPSYSPAPPGYPSGPYASSPYGPSLTPNSPAPESVPGPAGPPSYTPAPGAQPAPPPYTPAPGGPPSYVPAPEIVPTCEGPRWRFAADALFLERTIGSNVLLGYTVYNPGSGLPQAIPTDTLYSGDEAMGLETGTRLELGRRITDNVALDAVYWGLQQWSVGRQIYGDPFGDTVLGFSPWTQTDALIGGFNNYVGYTYKSQANNVEINERIMLSQRDPYHSLAWLWGFRYFQLGERFDLSGDDLDTGDFENINWKTTNNLVGLQAGLQWIKGWDRFQLVTEGKAGLFANMYSQKGNNLDSSGVIYGDPAGFVPFSVSHDGTDLSGLFELSIMAKYRLNDFLWLRLGYQGYCITGLALAARQLGGYSHGGTVEFDGPSLGLEATW